MSAASITPLLGVADSATVQHQGRSHELRIAVSGSGARYVGGGLQWWVKGAGAGAQASLFRLLSDGGSEELIERCVGVEGTPP